jgi:hypothetical protein
MRNNYLVNTWLINLAVTITALLPGWAMSQADSTADWMFAGHTKYQYIHTSIPNDSVLQSISGDSLQDHNLEVRLMAAARRGFWNLDVHLQFITVYSDSLAGLRDQPRIIFPGADVINDDRRWFNLTLELNNEDKNATLLRLDRASVAYTGRKTVIRFGRQAISWGNGLLFTPMDIFNPFDPSAVDKEYKSGDDMLYGQYLLDNGNDLQAVAVVRRHPSSGEVEKDESSMAVKYHGFLAGHEYDLLLAEHYGERVFGLGASTDYGGAVWRCDLVWTDTDSGSVFSALGGASYSWVAGEHNWSGVLEYYYNGFGQSDGDYSTASLADNPALLQRLARGELFNLGRHYLGAAVSVEITPLLNLSSNTFVNIADPSALAQLVLAYDWKQDLQLLAALNIPVGPNGSEYGGIATEQSDLFASTGVSLFAQLAWYF